MAGPEHSWMITSQVRDQPVNTGAGQTVIGTYVYYITGDGNEGSVFVPDSLYSEKYAEERVAHEARKQDRIGRLRSANWSSD